MKIPDELPYEQVRVRRFLSTADLLQAAPMTCAGVTIYNAIKKANLKSGQVIGISGLGALGHIGVQIAKALVSQSRPNLPVLSTAIITRLWPLIKIT